LGLVEWMALVSAAAGAFIGAFSAFFLENRRQKRLRGEQQLLALQRVDFLIRHQLVSLKGFRTSVLDCLRDDADRYSKLGHIVFELSELSASAEDVVFLIGQGDGQLLFSIEECSNIYRNALSAIRRREDALQRAYYSDRCAVAAFDHESGSAAVEPDPRDVADLKILTDALYECVDTAIESHETALPLVEAAIQSRS
jgi:hypothetical protein